MKIIIIHFCLRFFYYLCAVRVITLKHNNEELRNTNGCYLVTLFSGNPNNRFILRQLQILRFFRKKVRLWLKATQAHGICYIFIKYPGRRLKVCFLSLFLHRDSIVYIYIYKVWTLQRNAY